MKKKASKKAKKSSYIKVRDLKPDKNPKGGYKEQDSLKIGRYDKW